MTTTEEAIYENGVSRPLSTLSRQEHATVRLVVHFFEDNSALIDSDKSGWHRQSELALMRVWGNDEDDVYKELLAK